MARLKSASFYLPRRHAVPRSIRRQKINSSAIGAISTEAQFFQQTRARRMRPERACRSIRALEYSVQISKWLLQGSPPPAACPFLVLFRSSLHPFRDAGFATDLGCRAAAILSNACGGNSRERCAAGNRNHPSRAFLGSRGLPPGKVLPRSSFCEPRPLLRPINRTTSSLYLPG